MATPVAIIINIFKWKIDLYEMNLQIWSAIAIALTIIALSHVGPYLEGLEKLRG